MKISNDPIGDMLTRIRNASAVSKPEVVLPYSKMKHSVAVILGQEGYVGKVTKLEAGEGDAKFAQLRIGLRYNGKNPVVKSIKRISKPGLRIYRKSYNLPVVLNHMGIAIISTSEGLMTNHEARKRGVGGEVLCEVY